MEDVMHALSTARRWEIGTDPLRWLYIGADSAGRTLEIVAIEGDDGEETVIHAMKVRKKYHPRGGRP